MTVKFANNASTTVGTGINASATSLTVASASSFPQLSGADDYCYLTIQGATNTTREVVKATALSSNTFTIVRAQDNTSAASWSAGDIVELRMTAALLTDVIDAATVEGVKTNFQYTPTAGQTVFSGADNASNTLIINQAALVSVYLNGIRLVQGSDYSVSSANNTVTLTAGVTTADIVDVEVFGNFTGQSGAAVAITGGAISGASVAATTLSASGTATLNTFVSNNITVSGGSINNVNIGATTAGTGRFSTLTSTGDTSLTGSSSGSTVLTLTSGALADTPLMVFQRTGGAVAGKLAYEDGNTAMSFGTTTAHELKFLTGNNERMQITSAGDVEVKGGNELRVYRTDNATYGSMEYLTGAGGLKLRDVNGDGMTFSGATSDYLTITGAGVATFSGAVTANAGVVVDNITIDGTEIDLSSGDLTLDVAGDIILDAAGRDIKFLQDGTQYLSIFNDVSNNVIINSVISDKDISFTGNDGGSSITALTLNMSEAGEATFNSDVLLGDSKVLRFGADQDFRISFNGSNALFQNVTSNSDIVFIGKDGSSDVTALTLDMSAAGAATFNDFVAANKLSISAADGVRDADYVGSFHNQEATSGRNFGVSIAGGSSSADIALNVVNGAADTMLLRVLGNGTTQFGGNVNIVETATATAPIRTETAGGAANTVRNQISMFSGGSNGYHIATIRSNVSNDPYGLAFVENTTQRMALNSSGNLNVGMPSGYNAEGRLHVYKGASGKSYAADSADQLIVENSSSVAIDLRTPNADQGQILFSDAAARGRGRIGYYHAEDYMYFDTAGGLRLKIDQNGAVTKPYQPAFSVTVNAHQTNIAVGSDVTVVWGTEIFDIGSNFASNTFTAPVTGKYQLNLFLRLDNVDTASAYYIVSFFTSNRNYRHIYHPANTGDLVYKTSSLSVLADMDASDTVYVTINQGSGTQQTDVDGGATYQNFSGYLVA